ncbi:Phospholipase B-like [Entamoeba marina]
MIFFFVLLILVVSSKTNVIYSAVKRNSWIVQKGKTNDAIAFGSYQDTHNTTGWGVLKIETNGKYKAETQAFAAGFLEGYLTKHLINDYWDNFRLNEYGKHGPPAALSKFLTKQYQWWSNECKTNKTEYWKHQNLLLRQFRGLLSGNYLFWEMYYLNAAGDLGTLNKLARKDDLPKYSTINMEKMNQHEIFHECTSIVRILPKNKDIIFSHNTWRAFYGLMRIYKTYILHYTKNALPMTFSSSPGIPSHVMETTNSIFDNKLFKKYLTHKSALSWQRIITSMYYSNNIHDLVKTFSHYNSGTYNNQWIVTDLKQFTINRAPPTRNLLLIAEQIPGMVKIKDVSSILVKNGYWASYNIPHIKEIQDISGYTARAKEYGDRYNYNRSARRRIFDREGLKLMTLRDVKKFMLLNKFQTDPLTEGKPGATIASRYDLDEKRPSPFGAVDCKVGSKRMGTGAWVYGAPSHDDQTPFVWSESVFSDVVHKGMPDRYDFDWVFIKS